MATSLLEWIMNLMRDSDARQAFDANPQAAMASAGFTNVCGQDIADSKAFLFDNPNIREVEGVDRDSDTRRVFADEDDAPDQIRYIVNNYFYEAPEDDGPEIEDSTITDESTESVNDESTETVNDESTETVNDESTESSEDGNDFEGDASAGEDRISDSLTGEIEGAFNEDNDDVLNLTDNLDTGAITLLSDVAVDAVEADVLNADVLGGDILNGDNLNDSPILTDLVEDTLNDPLDGSLNDWDNLARDVLREGVIPIL